MTFVASVAVGDAAADDLVHYCETGRAALQINLVRSGDVALAWAADCPWIDTHDDGEVFILLDGRLHNLSSPTTGQAELLQERYRVRGPDVARGLLGDFVFIVVDRNTRKTLVARDPVGVRPWYYTSRGARHAGASDLATLVALPWVDTRVNDRIAIEYLAAVEESRGETLYVGVHTLRPGETWVGGGGEATTFPHHTWNIEPDLDISWDDAAARCREVLDEAVRCRLDVASPATSELSGGLDSSAVVGTAVLLGRADLLVGRLVFETPRADERAFSDAVIKHWALRALSAPPWIPTSEEAEDLARQLCRPLPDANFTMFSGLYRGLLAEGRRNSLTGSGGDNAFAAMGIGPRVLNAFQLRRGHVLRQLVRSSVGDPRKSWREVIRPTLGYMAPPRRGHGLPAWVSDGSLERADLRRRFRRRAERVTGLHAIDERIAPLTSGYEAATLETRAVLSDWIGIRETHPYLDPRFIKATYGLDPSWPAKGGHYRALEVAAFGDRLPPAVAERWSKADFSEVFWPQILDDAILERVRTGPLRQLDWLHREGFEALVVNAKRGMANAAIPLCRCVALDSWLRSQ